MNRIGYMVSAGCFPTREAAEAKKNLLEKKGVNVMVEDIDALTMRELVTAIMCLDKRMEEITRGIDCATQCIGELYDALQDVVSSANYAAMVANKKTQPAQKAESPQEETGRPNNTPTKFGIEIMKYLQRMKMSQSQLAVKAGVGSGTISRAIYKEYAPPKKNILAKIAIAADLPYEVYSKLIEESGR